MLLPRFATPLRFRVDRSPRLQVVILSFLLLSLSALWLTPLGWWLKLFATILMIALSLKVWRQRAELGGVAVDLTLRPNGFWLREREGESTPLQLLGQSTISRSLLLLCFAEPSGQGRFDCVLWQAELSPLLWRRLRVYLRLYGTEALR